MDRKLLKNEFSHLFFFDPFSDGIRTATISTNFFLYLFKCNFLFRLMTFHLFAYLFLICVLIFVSEPLITSDIF